MTNSSHARPVLLVTGGSRGIGAEVARLAARRGYRVALSFLRNEEAAQTVVADVREAGSEACAVQADVSVEADVVRLFEEVDRRFGALRVLVNNAGIVASSERVDAFSAERVARVFAVNVIGSILCAREAVKRMSTRYAGAGGAIINVSSAASRLGSPGEYVDYAASKGAIDTFTIGLAKEVAHERIRVNAVRPGVIDTEIHASGGQPDRAARLAATLPFGRVGTPREVAEAVLWLASEESSYSSGALLDVAGAR
ncbi:MAG TPA: SDR family oxidoreductase [Polyangiaceae bacterium]|nr:SDR family oxidoreductase [Polyangiaceae bacterium]